MRRITFTSMLCVLALIAGGVAAVALAENERLELPAGWILAGTHPQDYVVGADRSEFHSGASSARLASKAESPGGFGTLMQQVRPGRLKGERVRFTAYVRTEGVVPWAGLWMRVDACDGTMIAFDNMQDRPIEGDTEWKRYDIILDVPEGAALLAYGTLLTGAGQVWIDSANLEVVDRSIPTTGSSTPGLPAEPTNLDFEQWEEPS